MKLFEKILISVIVFGLILKFLVIQGYTVIIAWGFTLLAVLYFSLSFLLLNDIPLKNLFKKEAYKNVTAARILGSIGVGTILWILSLGILFDLLILPGRAAMLSVGITSGIIVILKVLILILVKGWDRYYRAILVRLILYTSTGLLLFLVPLVPLEQQIAFFNRNHPEYVKAYKEYLDDPENEELWKKLNEESRKRYE